MLEMQFNRLFFDISISDVTHHNQKTCIANNYNSKTKIRSTADDNVIFM